MKGRCQIQQISHLDFSKSRRETKKFLSEMVTTKSGETVSAFEGGGRANGLHRRMGMRIWSPGVKMVQLC